MYSCLLSSFSIMGVSNKERLFHQLSTLKLSTTYFSCSVPRSRVTTSLIIKMNSTHSMNRYASSLSVPLPIRSSFSSLIRSLPVPIRNKYTTTTVLLWTRHLSSLAAAMENSKRKQYSFLPIGLSVRSRMLYLPVTVLVPLPYTVPIARFSTVGNFLSSSFFFRSTTNNNNQQQQSPPSFYTPSSPSSSSAVSPFTTGYPEPGNNQSNGGNRNDNPKGRRRRKGFYFLIGSILLYMLTLEYEIVEAWLRTFDAYFNMYIGNLHPYGEYSIDDGDIDNKQHPYIPNHIITDPEELANYLSSSSSSSFGGKNTLTTTGTTKGNIVYAQIPYPANGRTIDLAILLPKQSSSSSSNRPPPIVINAGTIAAARPLMLQIARSTNFNCTIIAYTHSSLTLPKRLYSFISTPNYDHYGTRLENNNPFSFNKSVFVRILGYVHTLLSYTGDPLPLHSVLYMPLPESSPNSVPTSESQSNELSFILSSCQLDRAVLVSTAYHWLATFKCALRNPLHVAGLVCIDPYLPSTTPRLVIPTSKPSSLVTSSSNDNISSTSSSSSSSMASSNGLAFVFPLTPIESAVLQDTIKLRPTPRLSGPLQPVLNLPPFVLFAPQQLASKISTLPVSLTTTATTTTQNSSNSSSNPTDILSTVKPPNTLLLRDLLMHSILPTSEILRTNVTIGGADLIDAMFYRSQIIGGSLGPTGILPPWSLGTQISSSSPWYTRWFGIVGTVQDKFFTKNKKHLSTSSTSVENTNDNKHPLPLQTINHGTIDGKVKSNDDSSLSSASATIKAPLTYTALTSEASSAASPFLDLTRIATGSVYHSQNTTTVSTSTSSSSSSSLSTPSIDNLSTSITSMATTLSGSSVSTDTDYTSDGNNFGSVLATYISALRQRALGLVQGKTYAPIVEDDVRSAYVTQMLESLKAENHVLTLLDQASIAIDKQETAYFDYLEKEKLFKNSKYSGTGGFLHRWWSGTSNSSNNDDGITNGSKSSSSSSPSVSSVPAMGSFHLHNDKDAAIFLHNLLTLWSKLPMNTSSLAYSSIKNSLIEIALVQANVQFPVVPTATSNTSSSSVTSSINSATAPNPAEIMKELRIDILARALAAKLDRVSPLVWNNSQLDHHTGKVLQLFHERQRKPTENNSSSSVPNSTDGKDSVVTDDYSTSVDSLYSLSSLINLYTYGVVRWALPVLYNYQPYRWTIPIHALDRYMEAVGKIQPGMIGTYEVRSSPALDTAIQKLIHLMDSPSDNERTKEKKSKVYRNTDDKPLSSGNEGSASSSSTKKSSSSVPVSSSSSLSSTSSSSSSSSSAIAPLNVTMNIISFQGLLSWIKINADGAKNPLAWKYALQQAHQEDQQKRNSYASITNKHVAGSSSVFQPPSTTIPFPVSILVTEVEDSALLEVAVEPPTLEQDITLMPHLTGLSAKGVVQGFQLPVLGNPHPFLVHMRALVQSYQKLTRTAWSHTLPDCVTVIPAETSQELSRNLTEINNIIKNNITTEGKFGWSGLITSRGNISVQIKNGTAYPYPSTAVKNGSSRNNGSNGTSLPSSSSSVETVSSSIDKQMYWPSLVDYSSGDPRDTLAIVSDVTSYGPPQPYRPALSKVTREILTVLEVEQERQRLLAYRNPSNIDNNNKDDKNDQE